MGFVFAKDQMLLRDALGDLALRHWHTETLQRYWSGDVSVEENLHKALAEGGVLGLSGSEDQGGLGQSVLDLCPCLEEAGRHGLPSWVADHLMAVPLLIPCDEPSAEVLSGQRVVGMAFEDGPMAYGPRLGLVLHWHDEVLEALTEPQFERLDAVDQGRPLYRLKGAQKTRTVAQGEVARNLRQEAFNRCVISDALQLVGLTQCALDRAVDYAKERQQFGKPIGAQQALKHQLADALIALEFARPMVQRAAYAQHHDEPEKDGRISAAWLLATEAARQVERTALQVHGAMGYSYEYPLHTILKRSWALRRARGPASVHRQRAAAWILET